MSEDVVEAVSTEAAPPIEPNPNQLVVLKEIDLLKMIDFIMSCPAKDVQHLIPIFGTVRRAEEK